MLGQVCYYSFAKLWVPAGTRANHAAVGRFLLLPAWGEELGTSADISEYFFVDSWFLGGGGGGSSPYSIHKINVA